MPDPPQPTVTIGMPVFNGEATVASAIESILRQTFSHFKLIVSDNASTDATAAICQRFAESDTRIIYHRQPRNIGAEANFDYVLRQADTEYFMWATADDVRSSDFIDLCVAFLDTHVDYVAATCPTQFAGIPAGARDMGDKPLDSDNLYTNIAAFFPTSPRWHANGHFCSLFRLSALLQSMSVSAHFLGADWAVVITMLGHGKFHRLGCGHVLLGAHGTSNRPDFFRLYRTRAIHWVVPFFDFSRVVVQSMRDAPLRWKTRIFKQLLRVNLQAFIKQLKFERRLYRARHAADKPQN